MSASSASDDSHNLAKWAAAGVSVAAVGGIAAVLYSQNSTKRKILRGLKQEQSNARLRRAEEHAAIYDYVSASYGLNRELRNGGQLDERYQVIKDGLDSWLNKATADKGIYYRGIPWNARTEWRAAKAGQIITDKAFGSFSSSRKMGAKYGAGKDDAPGVVIVARGSLAKLPYHIKGRYGQSIGESLRAEREFLAKRNTQFRVLRTQDVTLRYSRKRGVDELVRDPNGDIVRKQRIVYVDILDPGRSDASTDGRKGKPCGESHISKAYTCRKNSNGLSSAQRQKLARIAAAGGLTVTAALGLGLILRGKTKAPALAGTTTSRSSALRTHRSSRSLPTSGRTIKALPQKSSFITDEDFGMLTAYIEGSSSLNRALRNGRYGDLFGPEDIRIIDNWIDKTRPVRGRYWRGIASERTANFFRNARPGDVYTDAGFGSFSSSLNIAKQFSEEHKSSTGAFAERVVLRTRAPLRPLPTSGLADYERRMGFEPEPNEEREFLAPRNAQYRILRIRRGVSLNPGNTRQRNIYADQPFTIVDLEFLGIAPSRTMPGRSDATEGGVGQPCGASYISKAYNCTKNTASTTKSKLKTAAKVALATGVIAGGAYLIKRKDISGEAWEKSPFNVRKNPKLSSEQAQKIVDEAIAGGQKWDVQEKINARRRAERDAECGGGLGKLLPPAKFDAAVRNPRCQAGEGAFGTYFVHPSEQYGIKLYRNGDDDDVQWEFDRLAKAARAGVNVPDPKAINAVKDEFGDVRAQTLVLGHMKGYKDIDDVYGADNGTASRAPLIVQRHVAQEFRKLHTAGLAHGDIHTGNILVHPRSKRVSLVDFGYATELDDRYQPANARTGVENLLGDMRRLPKFLGFSNDGDDFLMRYKGVLENVEKQANFSLNNYDRDEKFELAVKRYHDALERELLWDDRKPRSRFVSGADQPRIPGLTRRILTANANTKQREELEEARRFANFTIFHDKAKELGVKPARLYQALKPERDARQARLRKQPFGTPLVP